MSIRNFIWSYCAWCDDMLFKLSLLLLWLVVFSYVVINEKWHDFPFLENPYLIWEHFETIFWETTLLKSKIGTYRSSHPWHLTVELIWKLSKMMVSRHVSLYIEIDSAQVTIAPVYFQRLLQDPLPLFCIFTLNPSKPGEALLEMLSTAS